MIQFVHTELMPSTDEGQVRISVTFRPGTKKEVVDEKVKQILDEKNLELSTALFGRRIPE